MNVSWQRHRQEWSEFKSQIFTFILMKKIFLKKQKSFLKLVFTINRASEIGGDYFYAISQ